VIIPVHSFLSLTTAPWTVTTSDRAHQTHHTMADERPVPPPTLPEALRSLRISRYVCDPRRPMGFFSMLPPELRDMIFEDVLAEPTVWYRRHKSGCAFRITVNPSERPVFSCTEGRARIEGSWIQNRYDHRCYYDCDCINFDKVAVCKTICRGRSGLELLRTCKQVTEEAGAVFFNKNIFCFDDADVFVDVLSKLPPETLDRVKRVSLLNLLNMRKLEWRLDIFDEKKRPALQLLSRMRGLEEVELSPPWTTTHRSMTYFKDLHHLLCVRAVYLDYVYTGNIEWKESWTWFRVAEDLDPGPCRFPRVHGKGGSPLGKTSCFSCWSYSAECTAWNLLWRSTSFLNDTPPCIPGIRDRLQNTLLKPGVPRYRGHDLQPLEVTSQGLELAIFALPVHSWRARRRLEDQREHDLLLQKRSKCSNARKVRAQEAVFVDIDEIEDGVPAKASRDKRFFCRKESVEADCTATTAQQRRERREAVEKQERLSEQKKAKKVRKGIVKEMNQLEVSKRGERKRVGR